MMTADVSPTGHGVDQRTLAPLLGAAAAQTLQQYLRRYPPVVMRIATVESADPARGTVDVTVDGDPPGNVATATAVGLTPSPGTRCMVMFGDGGHLLCLGAYGVARVTLAATGDVSLVSSDHPFQIGDVDEHNIAFDNNEIQARDGTASPPTAAPIFVNNQGGNVALAGALVVGRAVGGTATDAYLGVKTLFNTAGGWGFAQNAAGATIISGVTGQFVAIRENGATPDLWHWRLSGGNTEVTVPQGLPALGGTLPLGYVAGSTQIGTVSSSIRFKTDLATLDVDDMLARARRLRPVRFRYRPHDAVAPGGEVAHSAPTFGLVAEEVAAIAPECVAPDADGSPGGLDPQSLIAVLVGAVQALAARVDALERRTSTP